MSQLTEQNNNEIERNTLDSKQKETNTSPQSNPVQNGQQFRFNQEEVNQDADFTSNTNTTDQKNGNVRENGQYNNSYSNQNNNPNNNPNNNQYQNPYNNGQNSSGYNGNQGYQQNPSGNQGYNNQGYQQNQGYNNQRYNQPYQGQDSWQQQNGYNNRNNQMNGENKPKSMFNLSGTPFGMLKEQGKLPKIKTDDEARNLYYGMNIPYYQNVFKKYKNGQKANWNWSAFFFQSYWFFSRKMYIIGSLYAVAMSFISIAVMQIYDNMTNPNITLMILPWAIAFIGLWVAGGLFGNYVYMSHMENKIVYPSENKDSNEKMVQLNVMRGGFSIYGVLLCIVATDLIATIIQSIFGLL